HGGLRKLVAALPALGSAKPQMATTECRHARTTSETCEPMSAPRIGNRHPPPPRKVPYHATPRQTLAMTQWQRCSRLASESLARPFWQTPPARHNAARHPCRRAAHDLETRPTGH